VEIWIRRPTRYTEYHQNVHRRLRELHETVASSFYEVKAQCLPFPDKGTNIEEMIDWVVEEVKTVPDTIWQLNDNFIILGIEGILNMLNSEGCQEWVDFVTWPLPAMLLCYKMFSKTCGN
jgi:hypothetical protein